MNILEIGQLSRIRSFTSDRQLPTVGSCSILDARYMGVLSFVSKWVEAIPMVDSQYMLNLLKTGHSRQEMKQAEEGGHDRSISSTRSIDQQPSKSPCPENQSQSIDTPQGDRSIAFPKKGKFYFIEYLSKSFFGVYHSRLYYYKSTEKP